MIDSKRVYALIPARGASKRLPGKNIKLLCGKPLIAYSIDEALKSSYIDRVIVSTDSKKIAEVSKNFNADVPFLRPETLSTDDASSYSVINHLIDFLKDENAIMPDIIIMLQPTSPLRTSLDIDRSLQLLVKSNSGSIVSLVESCKSPLWYKCIDKNGYIKEFITGQSAKNDDKKFLLNGAIYAFYTDYYLKNKTIMGENTLAYIMPSERSIDIDTEIEFKLAELILRGNNVD